MKALFLSLIQVVVAATMIPAASFSQGTDWGDAPDPAYPTLAANNGAYHFILPGMHLGITVDAEMDGQVMTGNATGDDINGADDADGVIFNSWLLPGQNATVIVIASMPGLLNAWLDFNKDGDWADAGEQIFTDIFLNPGHNLLSLAVPSGVPTNSLTFARFRFSNVGGLSFLGPAPDGEVEDYQVMLGPSPTGDIFIDPDPTMTLVQNEISIAMIPGSNFGPPSLLVAAYNDEPFAGGPGLGISYSNDAGATWGNIHIPYPVNTLAGGIPMVDMFDPSVTVDDSGHVFVAEIATDANWWVGPVSGLFVHKSIDGGISWQPEVAVSLQGPPSGTMDTAYRFNDRDQICADRYSGSPYYNNIYVTWIQDRGWGQPLPYSDIYFSYSTDGGNNFSPPHRINNWAHNMGNMPVPDVAKDGTVYVAWMDYNVWTGGQGVIYLDKSIDGGVSWGTDILVDTIDLPPLHLNGNTDTRAKGAPVIKVKPSDPATLYIVYAADPDGPGPDEADIFLIRSTDAGNSWSPPLRVNDDATQSDQVLPWIYVKPNGVVDICWYDRRNDLSDFDFDIYFTYSTNDGNSFAPNVKVNNVMFPPPFVPKTGDAWIGEYMAITADYYTAYMVHTSSAFDGLGDVIFVTAENPDQSIDRGDAPDPGYPTMALNNGASHDMDGVSWLGALIDAEPDGIPDASALGDDNLNLDDEDGVVFPGGNILIGTSNSVDVTASVNGYLNAWIDFNQDGDWMDPNEQIFTDQMLSASVNNLNFNVPATALSGNTFARFRFNTQGGLSFNGHAADGEVEDYMVILENMTDFGDAPDNTLAYPGSGTSGAFPTCITGSNPGQYVMHFPSSIWLGPAFDAETDGNAGLCSPFSTPYDSDECFQDNDAGLIIPSPYTITGPAGQEQVVPCAGIASPLDTICSMVHWGSEVDIQVVNNSSSPAYLNVLVDWNQDGLWALNSGTICNSTVVPEHVLVDFPVPAAYNGTLSALGPPSFLSGPNTGYCWSRFTISDQQVGNNWQGSGEFDDGETEDYLLELVLNTDIYTPERQSGTLRMIPNPTTGHASVLFFNPEYGETSLWIYNITGKTGSLIYQQILTKGLHTYAWEGSLPDGYQVKPGFYILEHRLNNLTVERIRIVIR